jgi:non-ribosomal peptide synthetase component F
MIDHYRILLEGIVANPEQPITTLPMLTEAERRQLLRQWNDTDGAKEAAVGDASELEPDDLEELSDEELTTLLKHYRSGHDDVASA